MQFTNMISLKIVIDKCYGKKNKNQHKTSSNDEKMLLYLKLHDWKKGTITIQKIMIIITKGTINM